MTGKTQPMYSGKQAEEKEDEEAQKKKKHADQWAFPEGTAVLLCKFDKQNQFPLQSRWKQCVL